MHILYNILLLILSVHICLIRAFPLRKVIYMANKLEFIFDNYICTYKL